MRHRKARSRAIGLRPRAQTGRPTVAACEFAQPIPAIEDSTCRHPVLCATVGARPMLTKMQARCQGTDRILHDRGEPEAVRHVWSPRGFRAAYWPAPAAPVLVEAANDAPTHCKNVSDPACGMSVPTKRMRRLLPAGQDATMSALCSPGRCAGSM